MTLPYELIQIEQGTPEWKALRLTKITASKMPMLFGVSPYGNALDVYLEMVTGKEAPIDTFQRNLFEKGHRAEAFARRFIFRELGLELLPEVMVSKKEPRLLASLDGFDADLRIVLEAKYMGKKNLAQVKAGVIQPHHYCQVQTQLLVSGAEKCIYIGIDTDRDTAMLEVFPDPEYFKKIWRVTYQFLECLATDTPPDSGFGFHKYPAMGDEQKTLTKKIVMNKIQKFARLKAEVG